MRRRHFLALGSGLAASTLLAGCTDGENASSPPTTDRPTDSNTESPATSDPEKPDGIYVQSFSETMAMQGTASAGDYQVALMFTVPHTFWTMTGWERSETPKTDADSIHLMAVVWDDESGTVLPDAGVSVELADDSGSLVSQEVVYPMLSQPMGFHYGGNFELPGNGTYTATVSVGGVSARTTGEFEGRFESAASTDFDLAFTEETRERISASPLDASGDPGALKPMETSYPKAVAPAASELPGAVRGTAAIDDAYFVVTNLHSAARVGEPDSAYLAVSARTRYNKYELSAMALDATLIRDDEMVYEGPLARTLSPDVGYHYGAAVPDVQSGDELTLSVATPPQVSRHEGYETAFRQMRSDVTLTL